MASSSPGSDPARPAQPPRGLQREHIYLWVVGAGGLLWLVAAVGLHAPRWPVVVLAMAVYSALSEIWPIRLRFGTISVLTVFLVPTAVITGPVGAAVGCAVANIVASLVRGRPVRIALFNGGQYTVALLASAAIMQGMFGNVFVLPLRPWAIVLWFAIFLVVNHVLVDTYFLLARFAWRESVLDALWLDLMTSAVGLPIGLGAAFIYVHFSWLGVFSVATPLLFAGFALHAYENLRVHERNLQLLFDAYQSFANAGEIGTVLTVLRDRMRRIFPNALAYAGTADLREGLVALDGNDFALPFATAARARTERKEIVLGRDEAARLLTPQARSGILLPIVTSRGLSGLVAFAWPYEATVDAEDLNVFSAATQLASLTCERESLLRETERLAATDPRLPGLYNYRYLIARLEEGLQVDRRTGGRLALVYLDLDAFKQYNDDFGHLAGDEVLREFANILAAHTRETDVAARYAGDEFVLLLAHADERQAEQVVRRLQEAVRSHRYLVGIAVDDLSLDFSYGIACDEGGSHDPRSLIDQADRAMYVQKRAKKKAYST